MVEIREESSTRHDGDASIPPSGGRVPPQFTQPQCTLASFLNVRQMDVLLFLTRVISVLCAVYYILPFASRQAQYSAYSKAFVAAAATNALRVHQRVGWLRFTREFLSSLLREDSFHYLIFSVLFISTTPITMALMPIFLYALLHAASFAVQACFATGNAVAMAQKISEMTNQHTQNLLGVVACSEVFLMPMLIAMVFTGKASIFVPFIYYRFLTLRYLSRRNHSTKLVFAQLRGLMERIVTNPSCPQFLRYMGRSIITFICRLCPAAV